MSPAVLIFSRLVMPASGARFRLWRWYRSNGGSRGSVGMADDANTTLKSYLDWSDRGEAGFWRYLLGLLLVLVVFFLLSGAAVVPFAVLVVPTKNPIHE
jgi:hypothetical protein